MKFKITNSWKLCVILSAILVYGCRPHTVAQGGPMNAPGKTVIHDSVSTAYGNQEGAAAPVTPVMDGSKPALTLIPGIYKLQWKIPGPDTGAACSNTGIRSLSKDEWQQFKRLVSKKALISKFDEWIVLVDGSRRGDSGFDIAYLIPISSKTQKPSLRNAHRMPLLPGRKGMLHSDKSRPYLADWIIGDKTRHITKKVAISLKVGIEKRSSGHPLWVGRCEMDMRGGWIGTIPTNHGSLSVCSSGPDNSRAYNDKSIDIGAFTGKNEDGSKIVGLGRPFPYQGKLYIFTASATGDTLTIQPYKGPEGRFHLSIDRICGTESYCKELELMGPIGRVMAYSGLDVPLPPGQYFCSLAIIDIGKQATILVRPKTTISIKDNETTTFTIHGPLTLKFHMDPNVSEFHRGDHISISTPIFTLGNYAVQGPNGNLLVNAKNNLGNVLATTSAGRDSGGGFWIGQDWEPGAYTLEASFRLRDGSTLISISKNFRVVK